MMNYIWVVMMAIAIIAGICTGNIDEVQTQLFTYADEAVKIAIGLIGTMAFFC